MYSGIFAFIFFLGLSYTAKTQQKATTKPESRNENKPVGLPDDRLHINPAKQAEFPTGEEGWKIFLENNMDRGVPLRNQAPAGHYTVVVRCIVSYWGSSSDVTAETRHGYGMEDEVLRVIKKAPRWLPARHGGRVVNSLKKLSVTFIVGNP